MIILGTPKMTITTMQKKHPLLPQKRVKLFSFDENGRYETDDKTILEKAAKKFEIVESKFKCTKCSFEAESKGLLLAHYRAEHPKGGK